MVAITSQSYKQRQAGRNNHCKRSIPLAAFATISFTMMIFSPFKNYTTTPTVDPALTAEIAQSTPIHGHLHKSGMLDPKAWHLSYGKYRRDELLKWVEQRDSNSTNNTTTTLDDGPLRPPVVFNHYDLQGCPVYFNQKYKFIYLRTPKVGSTSVLNYFKECTTADHNKATGKKTETTKQPEFCLEKLHLQQHLSLEYLQEMWKEYYVFAFSRNIYQRAVSQYRFLVHFLSNDANHCPQVSWNMYCKNPLILGDVCRRNPQCCPHPPKPENHWTQYFHVNDQTRCLSTDQGDWALDYLGRVEYQEEDLRTIIDEINKRRPEGLPPLPDKMAAAKNTYDGECSDEIDSGDNNKGGGSQGKRRRLQFTQVEGRQWSDVNYCTKALFYAGRHHHQCLSHIAAFYADDVRKLNDIIL